MATRRPPKTLADLIAIALSPALIIGLLVSLVFFLAAVCYGGQYPGRLDWTLFFYVLGSVLTARVAIEIDPVRARIYGLVLAGVVFLALLRYVDYNGSPLARFGWLINLGLMGVVWWSAQKLTWDCTHIDEDRDASGAGLLEAAGLEAPDSEPIAAPAEPAPDRPPAESWWARYRQVRAERAKRPHKPGLWVVYFSLAALPLFGLGQALIRPDERDLRRYAFWLMTAYVACALGLLLTTSFLGLRQYLRQRQLKMPAAMARLWLGLGGALIAGLILVGALLPRPYPDYPLLSDKLLGSRERDAHRLAMGGRDAGRGDGQAGDRTRADPNGKQTDDRARTGQPAGSDGKSGQASGGQKSGEKSGNDSSGGQSRGDPATNDESADKSRPRSGDDRASSGRAGDPAEREADGRDADGRSAGTDQSPRSPVLQGLERVAGVLKWLLFAAAAVAILLLLLRSGLRWLAPFTDWARRLLEAWNAWWASLFGGAGAAATASAAPAEEAEPAESARPFADFADPFADGSAAGRPPDELVRYSFAALEAWATERDCGRRPDETPLEFADRLGREAESLGAVAGPLALAFARVTYASAPSAAVCQRVSREVWARLTAAASGPQMVTVADEPPG